MLNILTFSPTILLTFLSYYFPFFCHSRRFVNDREAEWLTVLVSVKILCSHVHVGHIITDILHGVHQRGAVVIDVFNCDKDGTSDGFSRKIWTIREGRILSILIILLTTVWILLATWYKECTIHIWHFPSQICLILKIKYCLLSHWISRNMKLYPLERLDFLYIFKTKVSDAGR